MELSYRKTVKGIELTYVEAQTLHDALEILREAIRYIDSSDCDCDSFLSKVLIDGAEALEECNARLNVDRIVEE